MRKSLICLFLVVALSFVFAFPASAAGGTPPEKISVINGDIAFSENIGGVLITVCGGNPPEINPLPPPQYIPQYDLTLPAHGSFTGHIVRPNGLATEESWFEITEFTGYLIVGDIPFYYNLTGKVRVNIHNGTQKSGFQPIISIHSSEPIFIPVLNGMYSNVQMLGWNRIVNAS